MANVECSGDSVNAVLVDQANGEHLHYRIEVLGVVPEFVFGCAHHVILKATDFENHPQAVYEWEYLRKEDQCDSPKDVGDVYALSMLFIAARRYHITIEHRRKNGSVIAELSDLICQSDNPHSRSDRSLEVFCA